MLSSNQIAAASSSVGLDWLFCKRFYRLFILMFKLGPNSVLYSYSALIIRTFVWALMQHPVKVVQEILSYRSGVLISKFYLYLNLKDSTEFNFLVGEILGWYAALCVAKSFAHYYAGLFALKGRVRLTKFIQCRYISPDAFYRIASPDNNVDNPDQRITQDVDRFTEATRVILETVAIVPGLIVYYSLQVAEINNGSFFGPGLIYIYFFVSCVLCKLSITPLIPLIFRREKAEGDFRYLHVRMRQFAESISFMNGQHFERFTVEKALDHVVGYQNKILLWRILSTFLAEFISYSGAVISYIVIAIPIFTGVLNDKSGAELSEIISKNTFLCLYLINSFTIITNLADSFSEVAGYTGRIGQLIDILYEDDAAGGSEDQSLLKTPKRVTGGSSSIDRPGKSTDRASNESAASTIIQLNSQAPPTKPTAVTPFGIRNLTIRMPGSPDLAAPLVSNLSFNLTRNLLIKGPNGSGKSSLLKVLAKLVPPASGSFTIPPLPQTIFIPQIIYLPYSGSIADALEYGCTCQSAHPDCCTGHTPFPEREILECLEAVGMTYISIHSGSFPDPDLSHTILFDYLSPGEKQRLLVAKLLLWKPTWAVLDEGMSAIDRDGRKVLFGLIRQRGIKIVLVDHGDVGIDNDGDWDIIDLKR